MNKLAQDLPIGTKFEDAIVKYLKDKENLSSNRILGCHPGYDIEVEEIKKTLECKYDRMSKKTGNIAIEYQCYGKPSGISSTKADFWVIAYFHKNKWCKGFIQVNVLREACKGLRSVKGGDDFASFMYLMPTKRFDEIKSAFLAHPVEHSLGKTEVTSSSLVKSSI